MLNATLENSGTICSFAKKPKSPPIFALPGSSEYFLAYSVNFELSAFNSLSNLSAKAFFSSITFFT